MKNSWFNTLKNKKVLVIHPFEKSIKSQYKKLSQADIMPKFQKLSFIKAVQSVGLGGDARFNDWFEALDYMKKQIKKQDFDVAIIGCGAYGFPLASYVKELGKQGLHTGGATQLLFAIIQTALPLRKSPRGRQKCRAIWPPRWQYYSSCCCPNRKNNLFAN